jgi:hypothetical protein
VKVYAKDFPADASFSEYQAAIHAAGLPALLSLTHKGGRVFLKLAGAVSNEALASKVFLRGAALVLRPCVAAAEDTAVAANGTAGPLTGRVAVLTGGGGAIGAAILAELLRAGASHVSYFERDATAAQRVLRDLPAGLRGRASFAIGDVSKERQVQDWLAGVKARHGPVGVVVNNAAAFVFGTIEQVHSRWLLS